jgi:hypothetical protein
MLRPLRALAVLLAIACTPRSREPEEAAPVAVPEEVAPAPVVPVSAQPDPTIVAPVAVPSPPEWGVVGPAEIDELLHELAAKMATSPDAAEVAAGLHELGLHRDSETFYAQAALADAAAWQPVYDLARAGAKAGDETVVHFGVRAAVRRGGARIAKRASGDPYFRDYRAAAWFDDAVRVEAPAVGEAAAPSEDTPAPPGPPLVAVRKLGGRTQTIAKPELATIVAALKERVLATPVIHGSLQSTDAAGNVARWVVYEFSEFDACMATQTDAKAGKRECRKKVIGDGRACNQQGIALVTSLDPVTIAADERIAATCRLRKVEHIAIDDYDGDGNDEVLVVVRGRFDNGDSRREWVDYAREVRFLRGDGTTQFVFRKEQQAFDGRVQDTASKLVRPRSVESHDLVLLARTFEAELDELDAELWPADDELELGPLTTEVLAYDAGTDTWAAP